MKITETLDNIHSYVLNLVPNKMKCPISISPTLVRFRNRQIPLEASPAALEASFEASAVTEASFEDGRLRAAKAPAFDWY